MTDPPLAHLVTYLADRDEPCPACTYNLRGLKTDRCPECNRELVLQIRLAEPRIGAWIAALAAAAAMLGFNALILGFYILSGEGRGSGRAAREVLPLIVFTPVAAGLLALLIRQRRRFGNLPSGIRVAAACVLWALTIASAVVFFARV